MTTTPALVLAIELEGILVRVVDVPANAGDTVDAVRASEQRFSVWLRRPATRRRILGEIEEMLDRVAAWEFVDEELAA